MPNRIVREAILTSERVCSLGWPDEVFYRRLMSIVDDYGRHEANPQLLRSRCYPLQTDQVRVADITRWMAACQKAGLVALYEVAGKGYLQIENFGQQQRSASKCPPPPEPDGGCYQLLADAHLGVSVVVSEDGGDNARGRATPSRSKPKKSQIPEDFGISDRVRKWADSKGFDRLDEHLEAFVRKCKAKAYEYADFDLAFMEAIREDWAKLRGRGPNGAAPPATGITAPSNADAQTRAYLAEQQRHAAEAASETPEQRAARIAELAAVRNRLKAVA